MKLCNIYCEGTRGSHDYDILEKVLGDLRPNIEIKPIGGKMGSKAIMSYVERSNLSAAKADDYLMFRDRDFDKPVPNKDELIKDGHVFFSYRTTIENYLLDYQTIFIFVNGKNPGFFASVFDVLYLMNEAAYDIKDYQAVRHALGDLRDGVSFGTRWTEKDGILPSKLGLDECIAEAYELIRPIKIKTEQWTESVLKQKVNLFLTRFDKDFFDRQDYLIWFQGKDLAKSICNRLDNFDLKSYYKYAKEHFDYKKFADLVELRTIVENKIQ
ncbi:MAG: hypothetical protein IKN94_06595 [Salinivirgaceae bacterium]|nr:hypothetical protein [Salinivirgaceae bacterium]